MHLVVSERGRMADVNPSNGGTEMDEAERIVQAVQEEFLPAFLFLFTNPLQEGQEQDGSDYVTKLEKVFQSALRARSTKGIRKQLKTLTLSVLLQCQDTTMTRRTYSVRESANPRNIGEREVQVLQMHEILQMLEIDVPQKIKNYFLNIIETYTIPLEEKNGAINQHFVYTENRELVKFCNQLTKEEVTKLFQFIRNDRMPEFKEVIDKLGQPGKLEALQTEGLKDVAFYYLVMVLRNKGLLNRIHTHIFDKFFEEAKAYDTTDSAVKIQPLDQLARYPLAPAPPGLCIIFNVGELEDESMDVGGNDFWRIGSKLDRIKMKKLFEEEFNYNVLDEVNPTKDVVKTRIRMLDDAKYQFFDSLVIVFMSHGNMEELLVMNEETIKIYDELIKPITEIKWLEKKPKLFFIQACRKKVTQPNVAEDTCKIRVDAQGNPSSPTSVLKPFYSKEMEANYGGLVNFANLNPSSDMLVCFATMWYETAIRIDDSGSPYINALDVHLRRHGRTENLLNVLSRVHYVVNTLEIPLKGRKVRQAPCFLSSLQKTFVFPLKTGSNPSEHKNTSRIG